MSNEIFINGTNLKDLLEKLDKIESLLNKSLDTKALQTVKPEFISREEAATLLKISLPTLHDWTKLGWLQSYKIGKRVLYNPVEVTEAVTSKSPYKYKKYRP